MNEMRTTQSAVTPALEETVVVGEEHFEAEDDVESSAVEPHAPNIVLEQYYLEAPILEALISTLNLLSYPYMLHIEI